MKTFIILLTTFLLMIDQKIALAGGSEWYVAQISGRKTPAGEKLNKCVKSPMSPSEFMEVLTNEGATYTVADGRANGEKISPLIVYIRGVKSSGERSDIVFFKGKEACLSLSKPFYGVDAYDPSEYE